MSKSLLTITTKMLKPTGSENSVLPYRNGNIVISFPTTYGQRTIEVYEYGNCFEWRVVELNKDNLEKIVRYDSTEAMYGIHTIALLDALLFCRMELI